MGWIRIDRKIMDEPDYFEEPFNRKEAWIDLLLMAAHKERSFYKRGIKVTVRPGQLAVSEAELCRRWQRSNNTVRKYLDEMQNDGRLQYRKSNICTIITICKWSKYQQVDETSAEQSAEQNAAQSAEQNAARTAARTAAPILQQDKQTTQKQAQACTCTREETLVSEAFQSQKWIEQICMDYKILPQEIPKRKKQWLGEWIRAGEKPHENVADVKYHFNNWLRIRLQAEQKQQKHDTANQYHRPTDQEETERAKRAIMLVEQRSKSSIDDALW